MKKCLTLAILLSFCVVAYAQNPAEELAKIREIQGLRGGEATWKAEITPLSHLTYQQRSQMCGLVTLPRRQPSVEVPVQELRSSVDLRSWGIITPVRNQASCGSCWAFAAVACVEAVHGGAYDLSEQHLVSCCSSSSGCDGGYIGSTFSWIQSNGGIATEANYPYTSGAGNTGSCYSASGLKYTISGYASVSSDSSMKSAIAGGKPVDTGMYVYQDFFYYSGGIYKYTYGSYAGGHAVAAVGYDDAGYWIIKNSWGTGWGESGYFKMAFGECNVPWMAAYCYK